MVINHDYGLELTNNSKVGWASSLPRTETCINATALCRRLCYGNGIRYQSKGQKSKRARNYRTCEFLLKEGGPELLAENLAMLVDQARPRDWLAARITGTDTVVPFSIRVHDIGDFYSVDYIRAWSLVAQKQHQCSFWFYTRSFSDEQIFLSLTELAALPNCQGWLSADGDNYGQAILAKCKAPSVWKLALLQDKDLAPEVAPALVKGGGEVVNFPYHRGGHHVVPLRQKGITVCPAVTGAYKLESRSDVPRPCQQCAFCLP
jgi:hypothetical protein